MKIKIYILLLAVILLSSCSTKFVYNHLDWILEWYVDDLVSLNADQEWKVRDAVKSILEWHRVNQLPFYISTLDEAHTAVKTEITLSFLKRFYFGHEKAWMNLKYHVTPVLAHLLTTLSDEQVKELQDNMRANEKDVIEDYIDKTPEELIHGRTERMIDRLDFWIGDLNEEQKRIVASWSHKVKQQTREWINTREQWQSNFLLIVRESRTKPGFNELMLEHFQNSRKYWPDGYEKNYYYNVDLTLKMIVALGKDLTKKQKEKLLDRINDLRKQLIKIHKDD